jgi:hypothetical protein
MRLLYTTALYHDYVAQDLPLADLVPAAAAKAEPALA